jgi:hypothetical protein
MASACLGFNAARGMAAMHGKLIGYNRRRMRQQQARRWQDQEVIELAYLLPRGTMAALVRQLGVHRSTSSRDVRTAVRQRLKQGEGYGR